jgi:hypothetical protein
MSRVLGCELDSRGSCKSHSVFYELGSKPQTISNKLSLELILLFWGLLDYK